MMRRLSGVVLMVITMMMASANSQNQNELPRYEGDHSQYGEIRIWGNDTSLNLLRLWQVAFHKHQRGIKFVDQLPSTAVAMGALYTGVADLGLMGREAVPMEIYAFHQVFGYAPLEITVAMGSYDVDSMTPGNVIFVNHDNPLSQLFKGGDTWNPSLHEIAFTEPGRDSRPKAGGPQLMDIIASDPLAIAYTAIQYGRKNQQVKALALAASDDGPYVEPTKENFVNRTYPLAEKICFYINRVPGKPVEPKLGEFLRYILSRQGQQAVEEDGGYLPLTADEVRRELKKLD